MKSSNVLKIGWGSLLARAFNRKTPLNIMLSLTNRCNSDCSYCNINNRKQRELSTSEVFDLIGEAAALGTQRLGLWGGEPLLRDDLGEIINYAKSKGLFVTLDSNGHLLKDKFVSLEKLDHLILALDGPEEMHDLNRGKGSFQKTINAIKYVKGKIPVWTITVLTKHNLEGIDFVLETAQEYGFLATFQVLHHNEILGRNLESLLPPEDQYRKAIKNLIFRKKEGAPIASSLAYLKHILNWPDYKKFMLSYKIDNLRCWAGKLYCNIDTDGSVFPCSLLVGKMGSLNFLDTGFKKAFEHIQDFTCKACSASCFTEYNYLYSLNAEVIMSWMRSMHMTRRALIARE
jgi:MoaA/NifB/PqqE/SkfB family radical SAM enzyme